MAEPVPDVVSDADYLATVARAYLAAPPCSIEETELGNVLRRASKRLGQDHEELLRSIIELTPVVRASEVVGG